MDGLGNALKAEPTCPACLRSGLPQGERSTRSPSCSSLDHPTINNYLCPLFWHDKRDNTRLSRLVVKIYTQIAPPCSLETARPRD
ncbi:hypothetical protein ElyMa_003083400 [Elysia marginata]|uniref:Uncharacterized protein n=1 Tax=Elysia marginata TaxID=1093978 RepID=A0AAV4IPH3_9GAST|nr:hypothetical protein ElyMa_003083400 [Elysia marginata]